MNSFSKKVALAKDAVAKQIGDNLEYVVVLGSGLSDLAETAAADQSVNRSMAYADIPEMIAPSVQSHVGTIHQVSIANKKVAFCQGRLHLYEGHSAQQVAFLIYVLHQLGAQNLIITNAAGALNPSYKPGEIMLIEDHINHTGHNPIVGQGDELGPRFADMSQAYDAQRLKQAMAFGHDSGLNVHAGIYAGVLGPSLETSAERQMMRSWGADAVGMSTVMEVIAAKHCTMRVTGLSAITNMATGGSEQQPDTIEDVLANAAVAATGIKQIIYSLLES